MNYKSISLLVISILLHSQLNWAQEKSGFKLFPSVNNFPTLKAHLTDPQIGLFYYPDNGYLKVDLGASVDIFSIVSVVPNPDLGKREIRTFSFGADFSAFALGAKVTTKYLPIETLDGFFGFNFAYTLKDSAAEWLFRLKAIHNSSHLVDGVFNKEGKVYNLDLARIPYSKDYAEITAAYVYNFPNLTANIYLLGSFNFARTPKDQKLVHFGGGTELSSRKIFGNFLGEDVNIFCAYEINFFGIDKYYDNHFVKVGTKIGEWSKSGILFYLSFYDGTDYFTQYYKTQRQYFGFGFSIERI